MSRAQPAPPAVDAPRSIRDTAPKPGDPQLPKPQEELAHAARLSMLGELAASLAHELNQPLTAIMANAQVALLGLESAQPDLEELRAILADVVHDSRRAADVIQRARALVKRETHTFAAIDVGALVREVLSLVHSGTVLRKIRLSVEVAPDLPPVRGDKIQIQQVLLNLLLNAFDSVEACPASPREVTVRARHDEATLTVSVHDTGVGLDADVLANMYQPFYTTKPDGLGMGLPIGQSIISLHGGCLWAETNGDRGATFSFTLPSSRQSG